MAPERLEEGIQFCNGYLWLIFMELQQELGDAIKVKTNKEQSHDQLLVATWQEIKYQKHKHKHSPMPLQCSLLYTHNNLPRSYVICILR